MKSIDLPKIIDGIPFTRKEVAKQLFPDNKFPDMALKRVMAGESYLDSQQLSKLALLANCTIGELFGEWSRTAYKDKSHVFKNGDMTAMLDTTTWIVRIFHDKSLYHEEIILDNKVTMTELFTLINIQK